MAQPEPLTNASDGLPARLTGPWVHDKNYYIERYLNIFTRGVGRKWAGKLSYVDLFAGPGRNVIRGTGEEVEGSPFVSLRCDFARYVFVDVPEVLSTLNERLNGHTKVPQISLIEGDCNTVIASVRTALPANHLTLALIDPTGLQIQFRTIQQLVNNRKVDLLMTIQFGMGIRMNLPLYTQADGATLSAFLGNTGWREDAQAGGSTSQIARRILNRYLGELRGLGYETVKDREIDIRSDQNNLLLYFMVLASRHPLGANFWRKTTEIQASGQRFLNLGIED
jgi:three-Cys-motif partner protein